MKALPGRRMRPGSTPKEATMDWMSTMFVAVIVLVAEVLGMSFTRS
ncbi:MAG TPA: hypothetical protein VN203_02420 [Candidatus Acidoferrum sp.]|nr:hypothetical protein [Candidatus Acidoferrum sp.]